MIVFGIFTKGMAFLTVASLVLLLLGCFFNSKRREDFANAVQEVNGQYREWEKRNENEKGLEYYAN